MLQHMCERSEVVWPDIAGPLFGGVDLTAFAQIPKAFLLPSLHCPAVPCIARHIFSAVSGVSRWRTQKLASASNTALVTAAGAGTVDTDPMPLAPSGLVGDGTSSVSRMSGGISWALGRA